MIALALPVIVACLAAIAAYGLCRIARRPQLDALLLTVTAAAAAIATSTLLVLVALVLLFDPHGTAWCERFLGHGSHRALVPGIAVAATAVLMTMRCATSLARQRRMLTARRPSGAAAVELVESAELVAHARPGRPGRVVVSRGMLDALSGEERLVLFAHERAHLRHSHHRYIALADACAAAIPPLRPLAAQVRYACERWADEEAASVVGERKLVARAVAVAALAEADARGLGFGGGKGVPARVEAMLKPPGRGHVVPLLATVPVLVAIAAALLQTQRLGEVMQLLV